MKLEVYLDLVCTFSLVMAVVFSAKQAKAAAHATRSLVDQMLTDRIISQIRFLMENIEIVKRVFPKPSKIYDNEKLQDFFIAHIFLLHFESVLINQRQLGKDRHYYIESMRQIFKSAPVMREWMEITKGIWSKDLWSIADQSISEEISNNKTKTQG